VICLIFSEVLAREPPLEFCSEQLSSVSLLCRTQILCSQFSS